MHNDIIKTLHMETNYLLRFISNSKTDTYAIHSFKLH